MGMETISYRASQLWNLIPGKIKQSHSLSILKEKIRTWHCDNCPCRYAQRTLLILALDACLIKYSGHVINHFCRYIYCMLLLILCINYFVQLHVKIESE